MREGLGKVFDGDEGEASADAGGRYRVLGRGNVALLDRETVQELAVGHNPDVRACRECAGRRGEQYLELDVRRVLELGVEHPEELRLADALDAVRVRRIGVGTQGPAEDGLIRNDLEDLFLETHEGVAAFAIDGRHVDVEDSHKTVCLVLDSCGNSGRCPPHPAGDAD